MASKNSKKKMVAIAGSQKTPYRNAQVIAPAPSDERLEVSIRIRPKNSLPKAEDMLKPSNGPLPQLTHEEYEKSYGADAKDLALVSQFAKDNNLNVVRQSAARRTVILAGTVQDMNRAFGVNLKKYEYPGGTYRGRTGDVCIPASLASVIEGVFGLDNRPVAKRHSSGPQAATTGARAFTGAELAKIYNFPEAFNGANIEAPYFCFERGMLPEWPGPKALENSIRYDTSGADLGRYEQQNKARLGV